jgi:hypothetical protein
MLENDFENNKFDKCRHRCWDQRFVFNQPISTDALARYINLHRKKNIHGSRFKAEEKHQNHVIFNRFSLKYFILFAIK